MLKVNCNIIIIKHTSMYLNVHKLVFLVEGTTHVSKTVCDSLKRALMLTLDQVDTSFVSILFSQNVESPIWDAPDCHTNSWTESVNFFKWNTSVVSLNMEVFKGKYQKFTSARKMAQKKWSTRSRFYMLVNVH